MSIVSLKATQGAPARSPLSDHLTTVPLPVRTPRMLRVVVMPLSGRSNANVAPVRRSGVRVMCEVLWKPKSPSNSPHTCWATGSAESMALAAPSTAGSQGATTRPASLVAKRICWTPASGTSRLTARAPTTVPPPCSVKSGEKSTFAAVTVASDV